MHKGAKYWKWMNDIKLMMMHYSLQRYSRLPGARRGVLAAALVHVRRLRRLAPPHGQLLGQLSHLLLRAEVIQGEAQADLAEGQGEGQQRGEEALSSE